MNTSYEVFYPLTSAYVNRGRQALGIVASTLLLSACGGQLETRSTNTNHSAPTPAQVLPSPDTDRATPVVALDPGHGPNNTVIDAKTGLKQVESNNVPETSAVWAVALRVQNSLEADGYKVVMLKKSENENITFRQRSERADNAQADLAVSIHGDPNLANTGQLYPQKTGLYRGTGPSKTFFTNTAVAEQSRQYSQIFKVERQKIEGPDITVKTNDFGGRNGFDPGNIPMVQLFSSTPWIYSEKRMPFDNSVYSLALVNAIEAAVPLDN